MLHWNSNRNPKNQQRLSFSFLSVCDTCIKMISIPGCFTRPLRLVVSPKFFQPVSYRSRRSPLAWVAQVTSMQLEWHANRSFYQPSSLKTAIYKCEDFVYWKGVKKLSKCLHRRRMGTLVGADWPCHTRPRIQSPIYVDNLSFATAYDSVCLLFYSLDTINNVSYSSYVFTFQFSRYVGNRRPVVPAFLRGPGVGGTSPL